MKVNTMTPNEAMNKLIADIRSAPPVSTEAYQDEGDLLCESCANERLLDIEDDHFPRQLTEDYAAAAGAPQPCADEDTDEPSPCVDCGAWVPQRFSARGVELVVEILERATNSSITGFRATHCDEWAVALIAEHGDDLTPGQLAAVLAFMQARDRARGVGI